MKKLRLAPCLFLITFANFTLVTPSAAQQPPPELSQPPAHCIVHEFAKPCTTKDGHRGLQNQVCENNTWTDVGTCVPLLKTGLRFLPPVAQCKAEASRLVYCVKDGKAGTASEHCINGYWWCIPDRCVVYVPPEVPPRK